VWPSLLAGSVDGSSQAIGSGNEIPALSESVLYSGEEPRDIEPLNVHPLVVEESVLHVSNSSDLVVQEVMSFCHVVGMSYEGFEDELLALLTAIEASRNQYSLASSTSSLSKSMNKMHRELKMLACSINYDLKGGKPNRGKGKGRGRTNSL
jgi:hypothetical protein